MPFVHPAIFWTGLAGVSIPILIYLVNRRRFHVRPWAAMQFLLESLKKNRRRLRIEELILLALRCLAVLLLAMAIGRFTGFSGLDFLAGGNGGGKTVVFVLDDSCSMSQKVSSSSPMAAAVRDLAAQIESLAGNDRMAIVLASRHSPDDWLVKLTPVKDCDLEVITRRLGRLDCTETSADLVGMFDDVTDVLKGAKSDTRVVLMSDFRQVDMAAGALTERAKALAADNVELVTLDYGVGPRDNLTVEKFELIDKVAIAGQPALLAVTIRNNSSQRANDVKVSVGVKVSDGAEGVAAQLGKQVVKSITPGGSVTHEFRLVFDKPGTQVASVVLPDDELGGDNRADLAVDVRKSVRVLLVDGRQQLPDPTAGGAFRMLRAIDPLRDGRSGNDVSVVSADDLDQMDLSSYDIVILLSVSQFPSATDASGGVVYPALGALQEFVIGGGGLAVFTGPGANLAFYNGPFHNNGAGLSPLTVSAVRGDALSRGKFFRLDPESIANHEVVQLFAGRRSVLTGLVRFFAFLPADPASIANPKDVRILARFNDADNSPAIVVRKFGNGSVVMVYSSAGTMWNDWSDDIPQGVFVTPVQDMVAFLRRSGDRDSTQTVGMPIVHELPASKHDATVTLRTPKFPAEDVVTLTPTDTQGRKRVHYDAGRHSGCYVMQLASPDGTTSERVFVRNTPASEGELVPAGRSGIATALGVTGDWPYQYVARNDLTAGGSLKMQRWRQDYWIWALSAMIIVLAIETVLAVRFGHYSKSKVS